MTALEQQRKCAGQCKRCGAPLLETDRTSLCEPHRLDNNRRARAAQPSTRAGRRARAAMRAVRRLHLLTHSTPAAA